MATALANRHLADLHALASELGIERYRMLPREELAAAILERKPEAAEEAEAAAEAESAAAPRPRTVKPEGGGDARRPRSRRRSRGGGNGNARGDDSASDDESSDDEDAEPDKGEPVSGVLDITPRGHGFIRLSGLEADEADVYVSPSQIRRCEMQRGDEVAGPARKPHRGERYPALIHVDTINGVEPGGDRKRLADATPVHPTRRIELGPARATTACCSASSSCSAPSPTASASWSRPAPARAARPCFAPSPRRWPAATISSWSSCSSTSVPRRSPPGARPLPGAELAIATAEMRPGEQLRLVELAIGHATRRAESGVDVVLLVDSLSRIAVAADDPGRVKPLFGAGRDTDEESLGALTVIATALTDAEDDGVVERALETTETSLLVLDRNLAAAGVFPAINVAACRVSGEEHLRDESELAAMRALRAELSALPVAEAAAELRKRIEGTADNAALLASPAG